MITKRSAVKACVIAFPDTFCLPSKVTGPVLFFAFSLFALIFLSETTFNLRISSSLLLV